MACGCCDLNRIKKLFEEKRKKKVEVQEEKISEEEEPL